MACTCTTIKLEESHLGNKDLDEILRKWKAGGFPNLERLMIHSKFIAVNESTILGMSPFELRRKDLQTDDGSKKATFKLSTRSIEMSVTPF
ncbi:hypothetical protein GCK72_003120 [Caenorhabditis remanei]|uniref:Sdz-33 F-box domain-containing protein n=1 Tax=Caenorhabditis remanei TaxID=31234 RepID=A0A6A5HWS0_CAERE|nr:hypothetical protein GCK72_003120 [Caenorhabditis remanei]KAF1771294.1 hypothetical protein GCK72_003120 [Caenorhabditis remanei]